MEPQIAPEDYDLTISAHDRPLGKVLSLTGKASTMATSICPSCLVDASTFEASFLEW